jgi:hypothetical protein
MLEKGDAVRAAQLFDQALAQRPDEPVLLFGASVSAQVTQSARRTRSRNCAMRSTSIPGSLPRHCCSARSSIAKATLDAAIKTYGMRHWPCRPAIPI